MSATEQTAPQFLSGKDLKVGDTIAVWWGMRRDTIIALRPYEGALSHLFSEGAQLAEFATLRSGMTIDNRDRYEVIASRGVAQS